ncbi:MAG: ribonuclease HII [Candidatus Omnitrophica bacterium]|nr:ribonuclease HII [Candidatus Omnitrophota bacterium]
MYPWERKIRERRLVRFIAGIDEAGRGPLAGPVVAAAVIFKSFSKEKRGNLPKFKNRIDDSKLLTPRQRSDAFSEIMDKAWVGVGIANHDLIDNFNISFATMLAALEAIKNLPEKPEHILIDAGITLSREYSYTSLIKGDSRSLSIACASIVAKVIRDRIMGIYDVFFPGYAFLKHKGYGTKLHIGLLKKYGPSPIHRKSFCPVRDWFRERENGAVFFKKKGS